MSHSSNQKESKKTEHDESFQHDIIDYSTALRRENQRRKTTEELLKLNADFKNKSTVFTGFVYQTIEHEGVSNNEVVFDVLPSFEMYKSLQTSTTTPLNSTVLPPVYADNEFAPLTSVTSPGYDEPVSLVNDQTPIDSIINSTSSSFVDLTTSSTPTSLESGSTNNALETDPVDQNMLDNLHKLPKLKSFNDIEIQLFVTKDVPTPYQKSDLEDLLKEYTSGDVVHGYVKITNKSNKRIPFHLFTVTLEGSISIVDPKTKKQTIKRFLNMMDFSASWTFGSISPSANISYTPWSKDYDGCYLGLRNDRILEPHSCYKKFFTFKFPYNTLDTICRHQIELHTLLPPSFGVNKYKESKKHSNISINPALGYGHNGKRGSPILTNDLSNGLFSVDYSINAVLVGSNPNDSSQKLNRLATGEYYLRFIPLGFDISLFSSQISLNYLKKLIKYTLRNAEKDLRLKLQGDQANNDLLYNNMKFEQLRLNSTANTSSSSSYEAYSLPYNNDDETDKNGTLIKVKTGLTYIGTNASSLLSSLKSNYDTSNNNGFITITTSFPRESLPYVSPSLIRKTNTSVSKINSSIYRKPITFDISLKFSPSDHRDNKLASAIKPPNIKVVNANLIALNVHSSYSIPINLSSDIFLSKDNKTNNKLKELVNEFKQYDKEYEELALKFTNNNLDINKFIPIEVSHDIKAMKDINCDSFIIPCFENKIGASSKWIKSENSNEWNQSLKLNLEFKDHIKETLIPTFQSCLLKRHYCIQLEIGFKGGQNASLQIPVRLRHSDGNTRDL